MHENGYTTTLTVDASPHRVFDAVNDVRGWWSLDVEGRTDRVGAQFVFRGDDVHYSEITVTDLVPGRRVEWLVTENRMTFVRDQTEWKDTRIVVEIEVVDGRTEMRFSHVGLVPAYECFEVCSTAWAFFVHESLRGLITTGTGRPMPKKDADPHRADAEVAAAHA